MQLKHPALFVGVLTLIYIGSLCYVLTAYYHLRLKNDWNFLTALAIALPLVLVEYSFSLHGNHFANTYLDLTALDILIITMVFYFINLWLLNFFVLGHNPHHKYTEYLAFAFIIAAFLITTVIK